MTRPEALNIILLPDNHRLSVVRGGVPYHAMSRVLTLARHELSVPGMPVKDSMSILGREDNIIINPTVSRALRDMKNDQYVLFDRSKTNVQPVGIALVVSNASWLGKRDAPDDRSYLWFMALRRDYQHRGLGKHFFNQLLHDQAKRGIDVLEFHARESHDGRVGLADRVVTWFKVTPSRILFMSDPKEFFPGVGIQREFHVLTV